MLILKAAIAAPSNDHEIINLRKNESITIEYYKIKIILSALLIIWHTQRWKHINSVCFYHSFALWRVSFFSLFILFYLFACFLFTTIWIMVGDNFSRKEHREFLLISKVGKKQEICGVFLGFGCNFPNWENATKTKVGFNATRKLGF